MSAKFKPGYDETFEEEFFGSPPYREGENHKRFGRLIAPSRYVPEMFIDAMMKALGGNTRFNDRDFKKLFKEPPAPKKAAPRKKVFSLSELRDFTTIVIDGEDHGVNLRGDTMNKDHEYVGYYNEKTAKMDRTTPKPTDWDVIIKDEDDE
jgi:hypothetical protein